MSRNIKIKVPGAAARNRKAARPSTPDLSDSESGYSALDEVTDDDDEDEEDVTAAEEAHLTKLRSPRPFVLFSEMDNDNKDDEDSSDFGGNSVLEEADAEDGDDESWKGFDTEPEPASAVTVELAAKAGRRVRFADSVPDVPSESESTDTDDPNQMWPDLFFNSGNVKEHSTTDFRREPITSNNYSSPSDDSFDLTPSQGLTPFGEPFGNLDSSDSANENLQFASDLVTGINMSGNLDLFSASLLGQNIGVDDSDDASSDRTDTDDEAPMLQKKMALASVTTPTRWKSDENEATVFQRNGEPRSGKVDIGKWREEIADQAISFWDPSKRKMVMLTPRDIENMDEAGIGDPFLEAFSISQFDFDNSILPSPVAEMQGNLSNIQSMDDILSGLDNLPELSSEEQNMLFSDISIDQLQLGSAQLFANANLNFANIMGSLDDLGGIDEAEANLADDVLFTNLDDEDDVTDAVADSDADTPILAHLRNNSDTVAAFRRHQINQSLIHSQRATPASLEFNSIDGNPIRGLRKDKLENAAVPISPARPNRHTRRASIDTHSSPLAHKRQADVALERPSGHKRLHSISEVSKISLSDH